MPSLGDKLYSFGALSDVHVNSSLAMSKFQKALDYLNNTEMVAFTCISGDLTGSGTVAQFAEYRTAVATYSPSVPVYACTGNHDCQDTTVAPFLTLESTRPYVGSDLYYTFTQGNDVFIMFGMSGWYSYTKTPIFTDEALQWLYETLEANRNKRCFVFEHCPRFDGSGKVPEWANPTGDLLIGDKGEAFKSLMSHYKNIIWLHGHSHMEFKYQEYCSHLNYDNMFGCHSVHIPSLAEGRELNADGTGYVVTTAESSGYVADVYENHIVSRGRDFANNKFVPIATYCLDTTLQTMPANSFKDSTGTITT
jgi:Icc-related predicted phosphoesterase